MRLTAFCYADVSAVEVGCVLLKSWLTIKGKNTCGVETRVTIKFNTVTDYLFLPIIGRLRRANSVADPEQYEAEQAKFNYLAHDFYKFMNVAKKCILPGEEVIGAVEDSLRHEFQVPFVSLILFSETPLGVGRSVSSAEAHQAIGGLLGGGKTTCGVLRPAELEFIFGADECTQVGSAAVVSLTHQGLHGVLAIGSPDPQHYKSSLGTLVLGYVAEVLARVLPRFAAPLRSVR